MWCHVNTTNHNQNWEGLDHQTGKVTLSLFWFIMAPWMIGHMQMKRQVFLRLTTKVHAIGELQSAR